MKSRADFSEKLHQVIPSNFHFYFQPPSGTKIVYPACLYKRYDDSVLRADNRFYRGMIGYQVTIVTKEEDGDLYETIMTAFPHAMRINSFITENLYHTVYKIYY